MAGRSNTGKVAVVKGYLDQVAAFSLHSASAAGTGANELNGGSPAYARIARPAYTVSGTGAVQIVVDFNVGAGQAVAEAGFWDSSGNFLESGAVTPATYATQGTYHLVINAQGA
jgi:hypothetical protein